MKKKKKTKKRLPVPTDLIKKQEAEIKEQATNLYLMQQKIQNQHLEIQELSYNLDLAKKKSDQQQETIEAQKKTNVNLMNRLVNPPVVMAEAIRGPKENQNPEPDNNMLPLAASMIFLSACWLAFGLLIGWKFL
jgi:predicted Zn-dependent peptidase